MNKNDILTLFDYSQWANGRLLEAATKVNPEQFTSPYPCNYGSLRGILVHILVSYTVWLSRCRDGKMPQALPEHAQFPDVETFARHFQALQAALRAYLASLTEEDFQQPVTYTTSKGAAYQNKVWQIFAHVANHATQHRSEAAEILTAYGCSPGDLDLIWYFRQVQDSGN